MERIDVSILGRDYSMACLPSEKEALLQAVRFVDQRMNLVKNSGKLVGGERIAVMAAIQIAAELLAMRAPDGPFGEAAIGDIKRIIADMHSMLDAVATPAGSSGS